MTNGILLTQHNQEIAQWSPDPLPRERVGSGHETTLDYTGMQELLMSVHTTVSPGFLTLTDLQRTTLLLLVDVLTNS